VKQALVLFVAFLLTGCATQNITAKGPEETKVDKEKVVSGSFEETWDRIVSRLSGSFFVINNIEKDSGIINVSFSADDATRFINCGTMEITTSGNARTFEVASDFVSPLVYRQGIYKFTGETRRDGNLDGRMNIYVKEKGKGSSLVKVNARYVFKSTERLYDAAGRHQKTVSEEVTFQTGSPGSLRKTKCVSNGSLERRVFKMASE